MLELSMNGAEIDKRTKSLKTRGAKLDFDFHNLAVQCLLHAKKHGDVTKLTNLRMALPRQARVEAFNLWLCDHAPVAWKTSTTKTGAKTKGYRLNKDRTADDWKISAASDTPFWEYSKETKPTAFDVTAAERRADSLVKAIVKARTEGELTDADISTIVKDLSNKVKSIPKLVVDNTAASKAA
jgi:hypothetical protein